MKKLLLLISAVLLSAGTVLAQDDKLDGLDYSELDQAQTETPYFVVGAGYFGSFFTPKYDEVNRLLLLGKGGASPANLEGSAYMQGARGFASIGFLVPSLKNLRIGFGGFSGGKMTEKETTIAEAPIPNGKGNQVQVSKISRAQAEYSFSYNSFSLDYLVTRFSHIAVLAGLGTNWGSQSFEGRAGPTSADTASLMSAKTFSFNQNFVALEPTLNIEWAPSKFVMINAHASYSMPLTKSDWISSNVSTITGISEDVKMAGLQFGFGVAVGLFNQ